MSSNAAGVECSGSSNPNWKGGLVNLSCLRCGQGFKVKSGRRETAKMCSRNCWNAAQREASLGIRSPHKVQVECRICGASVSRPPSHALRLKTCSRKCYSAYRSIQSQGSANPNWKGGLNQTSYPSNFQKISKRIISIDGTCQNPICNRSDLIYTTHHIDYNKRNCDDGNLITLCRSCNSRANGRRKMWQKFYSSIIPFIRNGTLVVNQPPIGLVLDLGAQEGGWWRVARSHLRRARPRDSAGSGVFACTSAACAPRLRRDRLVT